MKTIKWVFITILFFIVTAAIIHACLAFIWHFFFGIVVGIIVLGIIAFLAFRDWVKKWFK